MPDTEQLATPTPAASGADADLVDLEALGQRLGVKPGTLKRRVYVLGVPAHRGSRGRLLFDRQAQETLAAVQALMLEGDGLSTVRRKLDLVAPGGDPQAVGGELEAERDPVSPSADKLPTSDALTLALETLADTQRQLVEALADARRQAEVAATMAERVANLTTALGQAETRVLALEAPKIKPWWRFFRP